MLRIGVDVKWQEYKIKAEVYNDILKVSFKVTKKRCRLSGRCIRHSEEKPLRMYWGSQKKVGSIEVESASLLSML